jgi:hypothetical protein
MKKLHQFPPISPMAASRLPWARAFFEAGFSRDAMLRMSHNEFREKCVFLYESGLAPPNAVVPDPTAPPPAPSVQAYHPSIPGRTPSGQIRDEQAMAYVRAEQEADIIRRQQAAEAEEAERQRLQRVADVQARRQAIKDRAAQIPPEQAGGIQFAICFPDQTRVIRTFLKEQSADDVFAFVAGFDSMFDDDSNPIDFDLSYGHGELDRHRTLAEQGITGRTLIRVVILE